MAKRKLPKGFKIIVANVKNKQLADPILKCIKGKGIDASTIKMKNNRILIRVPQADVRSAKGCR